MHVSFQPDRRSMTPKVLHLFETRPSSSCPILPRLHDAGDVLTEQLTRICPRFANARYLVAFRASYISSGTFFRSRVNGRGFPSFLSGYVS